MKESTKNLIFILCTVFVSSLFIIGYQEIDKSAMMAATLIMFVITFAYSLACGRKMIIFSAFLICFFTFVLGDWGVNFLMGKPWARDFDRMVIRHVLLSVYLSVASIFMGAVIGNIRSNETQKKMDLELYKEKNAKFEDTIKVLFYFTLLFRFIEVMITAIFVLRNSYIDLYTTRGIGAPYMVQKLGSCSDFLFYAYIALLPDKKKAKLPILAFTLVNVLSILGGVRGQAVKTIILILAYCLYRNSTDEEKWVKKKHIVLILIGIPVAIVLLSLYNFWRSHASATYYGFWNEFINFFTTQGGSIEIIAYEKKLHSLLPKTNLSYTFGPLIAWYKYGFIGNIIGTITGSDFIKYAGNTIGDALYGNNLGATITYLAMPYNYLGGIGMGTQYIAELNADFGYTGIILFNLFLGWFITKCRFVYFKKWYWNAISIGVVYILLGIGRDFTTTFVPYYVSIVNWLLVALVYGLSKVKFGKKGEQTDEDIVGM